MKIATVPSKRRKELIIIGILLIGLPIIIFGGYQVYQLIVRASEDSKPKNVVISNLTTSSVTISWTTDGQSYGSVIPVLNGEEKTPVTDVKRGNKKRYTHHIILETLDPNTEYQFIIISNRDRYQSEGSKNFVFKTAPQSATSPTPSSIYGSVNGASGDDLVVYALLKDQSAYPISTVISTGGNWLLDISSFRKISDKSLVLMNDAVNIVLVAIAGPNKGAVVEGRFSDLFDSNGKLKDTKKLTIADNSDLYSFFPSVSMLEAYISTQPEPEPEPEPPTPTPTPSVPVEQPTESIVDDTGDFVRTFRIVQDLQWIDMVTEGGGTVTGSTGESTVEIVNITDTGFSVIWVSESKEQGYINYGTSRDSLSNQANDERDGITSRGNYYVHSISVGRLQPDTEYYFEVKSGGNTYDSSGNKYSVKTFPTLSSPPPFESVTGVVEGMPEHNEAILTAYIVDEDDSGSSGESLKLATLADENGKWILSIADSRVSDGSTYFEYTSGDSLYVDIVSTISFDTQKESMEGISDRDVEISLGASADDSGISYTRVELLANYGILGFSSGVNPDIDLTDITTYKIDPRSADIPKTGILDNMIYLILLSLGLVGIGIYSYKRSMTRPKKKGTMVKGL